MRLTRETSAVTRDTCRAVLHRTVFCASVLFMVLYTSPQTTPRSSLRGSRILENHRCGRESAAKITRVPLPTFSRGAPANVQTSDGLFHFCHADLDKDTNRKKNASIVKDMSDSRFSHLIFLHFQFYTGNPE